MNREIKFRSWNGECMQYGGFSVHATGGVFADSLHGAHPISVMQFTGLKDANGFDIYEGDIVCLDDLFVPVTFEDGCFQIVTDKHQGASQLVQMRARRFLVAGNIHQNPELLK